MLQLDDELLDDVTLELVDEVLDLEEELLDVILELVDDATLELAEVVLDIEEDELLDDVTLELVDEMLELTEEPLDVDDAGSVGVLLLTVPVGGIPVAGGVQLPKLLPAQKTP